jgi:ATP-binding cassette subfamily F protein 3
MASLTLQHISLAYGDRTVLDDISVLFNEYTKASLAGINGAGKTTLLRIMAQQQLADSGECNYSADLVLGYMAQSQAIDLSLTVYQMAESAYQRYADMEHTMLQLAHEGTLEALDKHATLQDTLTNSHYYARQGLIDATLRGLGFKQTQFEQPLHTLSSGWRMRAALAKILLSQANFLILDEPSNYLDIDATMWLVDWLKRFAGGYLLVSHDRYFLDQTTKETFELFQGQLKRYVGSYTTYEKKRSAEIEELILQREKQDQRIKEIQDFAAKFRASASKAALVQSRLKELEKIQLVNIPDNIRTLHMQFPEPPPCGERVLYCEDVAKTFGQRTIFSQLTFLVNRGEKVALYGENGAGKTTLMRILADMDSDFTGYIKKGTGVQVGYFSEEMHTPFTADTVLAECEYHAPLHMQEGLRSLLGSFLFRGDDVYKPITGLSGGEKARLLLAKLFLQPFNLLILDEPTNHLDLASKDALLSALQRYSGTVLFVSHDRYFVQQLAQYVLVVQSKPIYYHGGYDYAMEQWQKLHNSSTLGMANTTIPTTDTTQLTSNQHTRQESKRLNAEQKRKEKKEQSLLADIEAQEHHINELEQLMSDDQVYSDGARIKIVQADYATAQARLAQLYDEWENL